VFDGVGPVNVLAGLERRFNKNSKAASFLKVI
jgi:hypothetical protein